MTDGTPNPTKKMNAQADDDQKDGKNGANAKDPNVDAKGVKDEKKDSDKQGVEAVQKAENKTAIKKYKANLDSAITEIMTEITAGFKDFSFPVKTLNILLNRMHYEIYSRINALECGNLDTMDVSLIVKAYRNSHSKAEDVRFLTHYYYKIEKESDDEIPVPPTDADIENANVPAQFEEAAAPPSRGNEHDNQDVLERPGTSSE